MSGRILRVSVIVLPLFTPATTEGSWTVLKNVSNVSLYQNSRIQYQQNETVKQEELK